MTVYIGNAVSDENGKAKSGAAGDQTGRELRIQPWYKNSKGWIVLRPKDRTVAEKLAYDMRAACENSAIGYDQHDRNTLFAVARTVKYDCAKVTEPCECDCSALVRVCLWYAGLKVKNFNTASEVSILMATDAFDKLTEPKYTEQSAYLKTGDILVTAVKGHTAIVLNDVSNAEDEPKLFEPKPMKAAIKVKGSVHVRSGNGTDYPIIGTVKDRELIYLGQAEENPYWYKTVFNGCGGFISSNPKYTELIEIDEV